MPIYDYHCDHCGHAFSAVQRFVDDAIAACPSCGRPPRRLLSNPALVFKGSGWYKTDSRGPEKKSGGANTEGGGSTDSAKPAADASAAPAPGGAGETSKTSTAGSGSTSGGGSGGETSVPAKKPEKAAPASS